MTKYNTEWVKAEKSKRTRIEQTGLYSAADEHASCGVGLVVSIDGKPSRKVVQAGIDALKSVWHRGAVDADGKTGDGCGLLFNLDHDFYRDTVLKEQKIELPKHFAVAQLFLDSSLEDLLPSIELSLIHI